MKLTKTLEIKIETLNNWLTENNHLEDSQIYRRKVHDRNYHVKQLIELQEYGTL